MGAVRLRGQLRDYDWGGSQFLRQLVGEPPAPGPAAELWLGAHPLAPATAETEAGPRPLDALVADDPRRWLGENARRRYGAWPHLLKVLDVARPLSLQVHPDSEQARAGFEREERAGIPRDAPHRCFRDPNPKPELAVALSEFWLLYGLAPDATVAPRLRAHRELAELAALLERAGGAAVFERVLRASRRELEAWLIPVLDRVAAAGDLAPEAPEYWMRRWLAEAQPRDRVDRGLFGFLLMNLRCLAPGEGIFQAAGVPHAYLQGQLVEIMANSDNVLRCGLTSKHVDPDAVLAHVDLRPAPVPVLAGDPLPGPGEHRAFPTPDTGFQLSRWRLGAGEQAPFVDPAASLWLVLSGRMRVAGTGPEDLILGRGEAALLAAQTPVSLDVLEDLDLFLARIPG